MTSGPEAAAGSSCFRAALLDGDVAFITGGSSGINLAIARRFLELGARMVLVARDRARLERARAALEREWPERVHAYSADVRELAALQEAADAGAAACGPYSIVIAGAAGNFLGAAEQLSANAFAAVVDIDLKGTYHAFRACKPHLRRGARLIAISAPQATVPIAMQAHACAAKAGIEHLVRTLAVEWGGADGCRVNAISPGLVEGTRGAAIFCEVAGTDSLVGHQPVPRLLTLSEVADAAVLLAGPLGDYVTGQTFTIDGGLGLPTLSGTAIAAAAAKALAAAPRR
jgi:NAD(P)-dependent dehydrogenase (short-subunit alcohol dehydrogenase family)